MKARIALLGALLLSGCQITGPETGENDPKYPWWELVFVQPNYMKVWVEDSSVQDINDRIFFRAGKSTAASGEPDISTESARGWGAVSGTGRPVTGADLPDLCPLAIHNRAKNLSRFHRNSGRGQAIDGEVNTSALPGNTGEICSLYGVTLRGARSGRRAQNMG